MLGRTLQLALVAAAWCAAQTAPLTVVSAASFARDSALAPDMIVTGFTEALSEAAPVSAGSAGNTLGGYSISIRPATEPEAAAPLMAIARGSISFLLPPGLPEGPATVTLRRGDVAVAAGAIRLALVAPGIFTANSTGEGAPAGFAVAVRRAGEQHVENLFQQFAGRDRYEPAPIDVGGSAGGAGEEYYLVLFGTGFRAAAAGRVTAVAGGIPIPVQAAQAHSAFAGLDQLNLGPLPGSLAGARGQLDLEIAMESAPANRVTIAPTWPPSGGWGARADLIEANSEMGVVGLNGKVYVLGGYPANRVTVRTVQVYDTASNSWSLAAPLPVGVNHPMPVAHANRIYVIGGQTDANAAYTDAVQEYDPSTNSWRMRARMPTARSAGAAVAIDGRIYVAGGRPPRGADFAVYDPARDEWTVLPGLPTQRNHLAAVAEQGKVYVIGGRFEGGFTSDAADRVEIYDPRTAQWTTGAAMPKARGGINGVAAYGCIHIFGGEFAAGVHPDHDVYNPATGAWTRLGPMPIPVHGVTGLHFQDGLIYLPGGGVSQGGSSGSRVLQVFRPNLACR
jgi:uncharacterized protein (TIGR03437 family)